MNVIVIGGGASGILHAIYLKKLNKNIDITVLEKNDRILKKLLKTGNGRCNISNLDMDGKYYNHSDFVSKLYEKFPKEKVYDFFKSIGLIIKNDEVSTRLYPYSESAKTVVDILRYEIDRLNISVVCEEEVIEVTKNNAYTIKTINNTYHSDYVVFCSGSFAQEDTKGYNILKKLGHSITSFRPGLVALKIKEDLKSLQGIRVKCLAKVFEKNKLIYQEQGELLFKEQGISGVLVLNLSRYVNNASIVSLDFIHDFKDIDSYIRNMAKIKGNLETLCGILPKMLALYIIKNSDDDIEKIIYTIHNFNLTVTGDYGYTQGQIVMGGVNINEINEDLSSKISDNLYICGEILDVDGASGGYNLHFAWTSAIYAAISIFEKNL